MLLFVRHGQTDNNVKKIFAGQIDSPLNANGTMQAKEIAEVLKDKAIDIAFCSPLKRASQTMAEIAKFHKNMEICYDSRLTERGDGKLEGQPIDERDDERWNMKNWSNPEYGETLESAYSRVADFLDEICSKHADKNILVVSHYGIGRLISCYFNGFPNDGNLKNIKIKNSSLLEFDNSTENIEKQKNSPSI